MKRLILILPLVALMMFSCEVIVVEEPVVIHDDSDHFTGYFDVEEYNVTHDQFAEYSFRIVKTSPYSVVIKNFFGTGAEVVADVEGHDIFIPEQVSNGYHVEGSGYINGNELVLDYSVHDHYDGHSHIEYFETIAWR